MAKHGKKYRKAIELVNQDLSYSVEEAVELLEKTNTVKFDPTVEIHLNLNLDPKHVDQMIRTTCSLPNGSGKTSKICVITDGDTKAVLAAGAAIAGWEELIDDLAQGNIPLDFDIVVASPTMMRHLGKIARVLGPKGLMPNPKAGTVTPDLESAVKEIAAGKFEFRTDKHGNIHTIFGKLSFGKEKLIENLNFFLNLINEVKPTGAKAVYINSVFICDAMGPSIKLDMTSDKK